jgi:hypothetical protein
MNPCELVARLNPGSVRLDGGGRGGVPEYTAQDIAAAIGMIGNDPNKPAGDNERLSFAREIFCAIWWPDGARLVWRELDAMIAARQFGEWRERADAMVTAQLAVAQAAMWDGADAITQLRRAEVLLRRARDAMWPSLGDESYALTRAAVIEEMRATRTCPDCNGRGSARAEELVVVCAGCMGSGRLPVSDAKRARAIQRKEGAYRNSWRDVYEWTMRLIADAERDGRTALVDTLGKAA